MDYRTLGEEDAQALWRMMCALDRETSFMMYEPGEREETSSPLTVQARIRGAVARGDFLLAAEMDGEIVGYLWAERGALRGMTLFPPRRPLFRETAGHRLPSLPGRDMPESPARGRSPQTMKKGLPAGKPSMRSFGKRTQLRGADRRT